MMSRALHVLSADESDCGKATTTRLGSIVNEFRDTNHPKVVTQALFCVLASFGQATHQQAFSHKVRDNIVLSSSSRPWRRSATWLALKVSLRLMLKVLEAGDDAFKLFKNFMLMLHAKLAMDLRRGHHLSAQNMHMVGMKVARRAHKLREHIYTPVKAYTEGKLGQLQKAIDDIWSEVNACEQGLRIEPINKDDASKYLSLPRSGKALKDILTRSKIDTVRPLFKPDFPTRVSLATVDELPDHTILKNASPGNLIFLLTDIEEWVAVNLNTWLDLCSGDSTDCVELCELATVYHNRAVHAYSNNVPSSSVMMLTVLELWWALDVLCCRSKPLLLRYSPEIPAAYCDYLLIDKSRDMERIDQLQDYILRRHHPVSDEPRPSMFGSLNDESFEIISYNESPKFPNIRLSLEKAAEHVRKHKQYEDWKKKIETMEHNDPYGRRRPVKCDRCREEKEVEEMYIEVCERPLPENEIQLKALVFECECPPSVRSWRDLTWLIVHELGGSCSTTKKFVKERPNNYSLLASCYEGEPGRIGLVSTTKPYNRTHLQRQKVPVDLSKVLVEHGLQWAQGLEDGCWTTAKPDPDHMRKLCSIKLAAGNYSDLQEYVDCWTHTQNEVIAAQAQCPPNLTSDEYHAFGALRAGALTTWHLILSHLRGSALNLNALEVGVLLRQAVAQAGPHTERGVFRDCHARLMDSAFCNQLLETLHQVHESIKSNWTQIHTLRVVLVLLLRLINFSLLFDHDRDDRLQPPGRDPDLEDAVAKVKAVKLLRDVRLTLLQWSKDLLQQRRLRSDVESGEDEEIRQALLQCALLCKSSFCLENHVLRTAFSAEDLPQYIASSMLLHDHAPKMGSLASDAVPEALECLRWSIQLASHVQSLHEQSRQAIGQGITQIWTDLVFEVPWRLVNESEILWFSCEALESEQLCHYNIVTGELRVDGKLLQRLPRDFTSSSVYKRVLGNALVDVRPSKEAGMFFESTQKLHRYRLYFGKQSSTVIIRASDDDNELFEILCPSIWFNDIPAILAEDTVQWFNLRQKKIEFRPLAKPWQSSPRNYYITFCDDDPCQSVMQQESVRLLDLGRREQEHFVEVFGKFEEIKYLHATMDVDGQIEVNLPRFGLKFVLNAFGQLQSREFSGMKLADQQSLGTLVGLKSRLVLDRVGDDGDGAERFVLIPHGEAEFTQEGEHVGICIRSRDRQRGFDKYRLSPAIAGLQTSSDLRSYLSLAYLHLLTAFPRPDELTGMSGMEKGLSLLRQSRTMTTQPLTRPSVDLLTRISRLSPVHSFDAMHPAEMEVITWNEGLSSWSQRTTYSLLVQSIMKENQKTAFLFEAGKGEQSCTPCTYAGDINLLSRAEAMTSCFYPVSQFESTAPVRPVPQYDGRDQPAGGRQDAAFSVIARWPSNCTSARGLWERVQGMGEVRGFGQRLDFSTATHLLNLDVAEHWGTLLEHCRSASRDTDRHDLIYMSVMIAFGHPDRVEDLQAVLAIAFNPEVQVLCDLIPKTEGFRIAEGTEPDLDHIREALEQAQRPFNDTSEDAAKQKIRYDEEVTDQHEAHLQHVLDHCPAQEFSLPGWFPNERFDRKDLAQSLKTRWTDLRNNSLFKVFTDAVDNHLDTIETAAPFNVIPDLSTIPAPDARTRQGNLPSLVSLMSSRNVPAWTNRSCLSEVVFEKINVLDTPTSDTRAQTHEHATLRSMIERTASRHAELPQYASHLNASLDALVSRSTNQEQAIEISADAEDSLLRCLRTLSQYLDEFLDFFRAAITPQCKVDKVLQMGGLWPMLDQQTLLQCLSARHRANLHQSWVPALISYALSIIEIQRCLRYIRLIRSHRETELIQEHTNRAHESWDTNLAPEWLLFEIQNDLLIRPDQVEVADAMASPESGKSSLIQLNMGLGKSAVITPILACGLANGQQLFRVVVLRSLHAETLKDLSCKLGGLLGKKVIYLPFSRKTDITPAGCKLLLALLERSKEQKDIMLTTPESVWSLQLLTLDYMSGSNPDLGQDMFDLCKWLEENIRDLLDESDEVLSPIYEMVYTSGIPETTDAAPDRWCIPQQLYGFIVVHAREIAMLYPNGLELIHAGYGGFPHIRILEVEAGDAFLRNIVREALSGVIDGLNPALSETVLWQSVTNFVGKLGVSKDDYKAVVSSFRGNQLRKLFILRGQLAHRLLVFPLEGRRFNVNYGLHPARCRAAVPYRALSKPSPTADFANSDVVIVATAVSYYYTGLNKEQLMQCMVLLPETPNHEKVWRGWATSAGLPSKYDTFTNVNLQDTTSLTCIYQHLRSCKAVIDYYLDTFVFPKECREYPWAWKKSAADLLKLSDGPISTGFAGTSDTKSLMPRAIKQRNPPGLAYTDAQVIALLLRAKNRRYLFAHRDNQRLTTGDLFAFLEEHEPDVDVIIDVGAQMLDSTNKSAAITWLRQRHAKKAAVYFNDKDELMTVDRDDNSEPYTSSKYRDSPHDCLFVIDDYHTRGIDITPPDQYRAAITLGPRTTRDRLVQGAMRMRKLDLGHSFCTVAPPEIHAQILKLSGKNAEKLATCDVVEWTLDQTCEMIVSNTSLYKKREICYERRKAIVLDYGWKNGANSQGRSPATPFVEALREPEAFDVSTLYSIERDHTPALSIEMRQLPEMRQLLHDSSQPGGHNDLDAEVETEAEKEIAKESPREQDTSQPPDMKPHEPSVSQLLFEAIEAGCMDTTAFIPAFSIFRTDSETSTNDERAWESTLFITPDFKNTVQDSGDPPKASVLRPVNFVLSFSFQNNGELLIISQHEACAIMPRMERATDAHLLLYNPCIPRSRMRSDELMLYNIPPIPQERGWHPNPTALCMLQIFSGQVHFDSKSQYEACCAWLGVLAAGRTLTVHKLDYYDAGRFVLPKIRRLRHWDESPFEASPLPYLKEKVDLRMQGRDWSLSSLGKIVAGKEVRDDEFRGG